MRFHPGAAPSMLGVPASELVDLTLETDELWGAPLSRWANAWTPPRRRRRRSTGYADQPHLDRECMRRTGVSRRAFLGQAEHTCACGHEHAASFTPLLRSRPWSHAGSAPL